MDFVNLEGNPVVQREKFDLVPYIWRDWQRLVSFKNRWPSSKLVLRMVSELINANPIVYEKKERRAPRIQGQNSLTSLHHLRDIKDPEHPYSLEELKVITEDSIEIDDKRNHVTVTFTPTVEHCSMATVIGLCLRVKLMRCLPSRYKVDIRVAPGSHATEAAVNKQLNDKERVAAALENPNLVDMVNECLAPSYEP
nr:protein AE7-like [Ipomoea batatas]